MQSSGEEIALSRRIRSYFSISNEEPIVIVRSPGRVNLIGEHTDYNLGLAMPAAIDKTIVGGIIPSPNNKTELHALDLNESFTVPIESIQPQPKGHWANYLLGVLSQITEQQPNLEQFHFAFSGNIPIGAGLSSSAALENCFVFALNEYFGLKHSRENMISISHKAEHDFAKVECGILDQYASMMGRKGKALLLDCQSNTAEELEIDLGTYTFLLADSGVTHSLASSLYNRRKLECQSAMSSLQEADLELKSLRDLDTSELEEKQHLLSEIEYDRCKYVLAENRRVLLAREALKRGAITEFGELLYESHWGLSVNYEVSCDEMDFLVELTEPLDSVAGARMMGGGFGGCTLNVVQSASLSDFQAVASNLYKKRFGKELKFYPFRFVNGTCLL